MIFKEWEIFYKKILKDFDFDYNKDIDSAKFLDSKIKGKNPIKIGRLKNLINKKNVYILGAAPSLLKSIKKYKDKIVQNTIICADGATSALVENKIIPDIILTDLDGKISDQIYAKKKGSIVIIHAHGDNIDRIKTYLPEFKDDIIGSTQTNPLAYNNLINFGGFTDGDRSVFLADHFNAKKIYLLGFEYDNIGKYSFSEQKNKNIKKKKLKWCKKLIDELTMKNNNIIYL